MGAEIVLAAIPKPEAPIDASEQSTADSSLNEWVRLAQGGDKSAFEELVRRTEGLARKTAFPLLRSHQVDDAVQEAYIAVYKNLHHLQNPEAFKAWLARIVVHACYALRKKTPLTSELEENARVDDQSNAVATRLDLRAALDQLKEEDRNILILREFSKFSYDEIAYITRLPVGTVRSKIHYGRKKLKELLQG